jgi:hypothetical protein
MAASKALTKKAAERLLLPATIPDYRKKIWYLNPAGVPLIEHPCPKMESGNLLVEEKSLLRIGCAFWAVTITSPIESRLAIAQRWFP